MHQKTASAAKRAGAETQCGNFEAGASQKTVFHGFLDALVCARMQPHAAAANN